jgi:hypothetical protein
MRTVSAAIAAVLVSAVQLSACTSKPSSLDASKALSSLTTEEGRQLCEDHASYMSSRVSDKDRQRIDCSVAARSVAGKGAPADQASSVCQESYRGCMEMPAQKRASACEAFPPTTEGCPATVGEADDCAEAQAEALGKIAKKADDACKTLDKPLAPAPDQTPKMKTCDRIQLMCPKVYGALFAEPALGAAAPAPKTGAAR